MTGEYLVELAAVELRHRGRRPVLRGLDLNLARTETVVVLGANGSGKTCLLRIVAGALAATAGRVRRHPRTVGYVPDRFPSQLRMPAAGYLRHMAALHRADARTARRAGRELLDALDFTGGLDVPMSELSKGNTQKIALAQALCSGAELLVLDEPFSGLDAHAGAAVRSAITGAATAGAAVLLTDHTSTAPALPSRRLLTLHDGRLDPPEPGPTATGPHPAPGSTPAGAAGRAEVVVTLAAPDPRRVLASLPPVRPLAVGPDRVTVAVPLARRDAVLASALALGCGVTSVATRDDPA